MNREYCPAGFRRITNPPRTALRLSGDKDLSAPGIGPDVEAMLRAAAEKKG